MSNTTYLIYTDLDGTLLDHDTYSFDAAKSTMTKLQDAGHFIIPNTSKTCAELTAFQTSAKLSTPFIFENGAAVAIPKEFFAVQPSGTEDMGDTWLKTFTKPRDYWLEIINKYGQHFHGQYKGFSQMSTAEIMELTGLTAADAELAKQRRFGEPLHWTGDKYAKREFLNLMQSAGATVLEGGRFTHICGETDKGKAMIWLTGVFKQHYLQEHNFQEQSPQEQHPPQKFTSVALGDSGNDIAMLEAADIAVQIKSPTHEFPIIIRNNNLYRTTLYGPAGWSEYLEKIILNKEL